MARELLIAGSRHAASGTPAGLGLSHHALASALRREAVQPSLRCAQYGSGFHRNRSLRLAQTTAVPFVGTFLRQSRLVFPFRLAQNARASAMYSATGHRRECLLSGRVIVCVAFAWWKAAQRAWLVLGIVWRTVTGAAVR